MFKEHGHHLTLVAVLIGAKRVQQLKYSKIAKPFQRYQFTCPWRVFQPGRMHNMALWADEHSIDVHAATAHDCLPFVVVVGFLAAARFAGVGNGHASGRSLSHSRSARRICSEYGTPWRSRNRDIAPNVSSSGRNVRIFVRIGFVIVVTM
jgi:hypothetical protein